jgi:type IV pilus assembly protein PilV
MLKRRCSSADTCRPCAASRGFSLLEVMVALVVLSVGLLGILKLEAAAVSSTAVASQRSLVALEAASLAASMHVNRGYWAATDPASATIKVTGTAVSVTGTAFAQNLANSIASGPTCTSTTKPCSITDMAAYDLSQWALALNSILLNHNYTALINCGNTAPQSCNITITWSENTVAINTTEASAQTSNPNAAFANPSYTLYVEP